MSKSKVYFTRDITAAKAVELYDILGIKLQGNVAVKLHSGEVGNQNFIKPEFWSPIVNYVNGTIVECNTAYEGKRDTTKDHWETMKLHGWTDIAKVDIMDEYGEIELPVKNHKQIDKNYVGKNIQNYNSMLVLSHFKGHPMGGFGGALKNISIGIASSHGKAYIHGAGNVDEIWTAEQNRFLEAMADAAGSIVDYYKHKIAFINVMCNLSVDCDCCSVAEDPCMTDIGMLAGLDPVALDQACLDLIYKSNDKGKEHFIQRVESRNGVHIIEAAAEIGYGSREYDLIEI